MSIEKNLERIANALEILAGSAPPANAAVNAEPSASGGPKATQKTDAEKKAEKAKKAKETREKKKADAGAATKADAESKTSDSATREDVQTALFDFCKHGPGKDVAKEVFAEFKAGSISTLPDDSYDAFIFRLKEVAAAVSS